MRPVYGKRDMGPYRKGSRGRFLPSYIGVRLPADSQDAVVGVDHAEGLRVKPEELSTGLVRPRRVDEPLVSGMPRDEDAPASACSAAEAHSPWERGVRGSIPLTLTDDAARSGERCASDASTDEQTFEPARTMEDRKSPKQKVSQTDCVVGRDRTSVCGSAR